MESEFSDGKRRREENPDEAFASPEQSSKMKRRKKKNKEKGAHSIELPQVCHKHELPLAIPIVSEKDKVLEHQSNETIAQHPQVLAVPDPTPQERNNVLLPLVADKLLEPQIMMGKRKESRDANVEHPELLSVPAPTPTQDTPQKRKWEKKKKNVLKPQGAEPEPEPKEPYNAENHQLFSQVDPELKNNEEKGTEATEANVEHPELLSLSDPIPAKDTPKKRKWEKKKKNVLKPQEPQEPINLEHPQLCSPVDQELNNKKEKGAEPTEAIVEHPQVCTKPESAIPVDPATRIHPEKKESIETGPKHEPAIPKKGEEPTEANVEHPELLSLPAPTPPNDTPRKRKWERKKKNVHKPQPQEPDNAEHHQLCCAVDPKLENEKEKETEPTEANVENPEQVSLPIPTPLRDAPQKRKWEKKEKNVLKPQEPQEPNNPLRLQIQPDPAIPICHKPESLIDQVIPIDQTIPVDPAIPIDSALLVCPKPAPLIGQTIPVDPAIPIDTEQKMKRKKRRKSALGGEENNVQNTEPPETPFQTSICCIAAPSIDPTISMDNHPAILVNPSIPTDPEQKKSKKKRKKKRKSVLKSEWAEPNECNGKPPEIPVQKSICPTAAPSIDQMIPIDPVPPIDPATLIDKATPIDPEQKKMMKKKGKEKRKSARGSESDKHNADPTAETPVQRIKGLTVTKVPLEWVGESSKGKCNAEPRAKTPVRRTAGLTVTKAPFKQHDESSVKCQACRQPGHKFQHCPRLKCLSKDEEVCFFCGEIGHSLGKCSVSQAGGGRFAKCLFCYAYGHFSNNCPRNGHGMDPMVVAANGWAYQRNISGS
ncbi:uncharacterized protein LOC133312367 isoform X2 [Gastrolobium bilobum]|uniref:uncharacterized protein LOC133312367 isoform X2 n=1 Tax=Gastrolobium bilobum TaxID=150636 RepID=UPI002AB1A281|nr:uncharacterized protein LOC133312367 isoform X2 [Gastrolobium bilobum]